MYFDQGNGSSQLSKLCSLLFLLVLFPFAVFAADIDEARKSFIKGQYEECIKLCDQALRTGEFSEEWPLLKTRSELEIGRYEEAKKTLLTALNRQPYSIRLRLIGYDVQRANGDPERARYYLNEINNLAENRNWAFRDPPNLVALGRAALLLGGEPRI